jgi:capsular polysaccharide biosynthesis protein
MSAYLEAAPGREQPTAVSLLRALHRGRWIVVEALLLGALAASLLILLRQPLYDARARVLLDRGGGNAAAVRTAQAPLATARRLLDQATAREVVRRVRPGLSPERVLAESSVASPAPGILEYRVQDRSPDRAAALATANARQFAHRLAGATVVAAKSGRRADQRAPSTIAFGACSGFLIGVIVALAWDAVGGRRHRREARGRTFSRTVALNEIGRGESEPMSSPETQRLVANVSALEEELERLRARLHEGEERLEALEQQKAETAGSVAMARRALGEFEERLAEQRRDLAEAEHEDARRRLDELVAKRDAAAIQVAAAVHQTLGQLDELDAARAAVAAGRDAIVGGQADAQRTVELPSEPLELTEAWDRLTTRVRAHIDERLEDELLDAAARSPLGHAIDDLPAHLRAAAQERRRVLLNAAEVRKYEGAGREA